MSSSVCHAPLSTPRMESVLSTTSRLCLRAAMDQYDTLLQSPRFNKPVKGSNLNQSERVNKDEFKFQTKQIMTQASMKNSSPKEELKNLKSKDTAGKTYSVFRQLGNRRKNEHADTDKIVDQVNLISKGLPASNSELPLFSSSVLHSASDPNYYSKINHFPHILSDTTMPEEDISLKFLALNALDLTAPASDILLRNRLKSWFQLSGHPDGFAPAGPGTVWKRHTGGSENTERAVYETLSQDCLIRDFIPKYYREVEYKGDKFIELQDLLFGFNDPYVMDIKLGTRTFLESEVSKTTARTDLYEKMIAIDPNAPTDWEHEHKAVTKLRYMQFREQQSSTCSHGFRIEAMKLAGQPPIKDLQKVKDHQEVTATMKCFFSKHKAKCEKLLEKLKELRSRIEMSHYFQTHEVIGSSIFMIYDNEKVGVWLIDFAKMYKVPEGKRLTHRLPWKQGNHEEGLLFGLDNLISTIEQVQAFY
ncbi:inositol-trisphosphate 3-kinase homolog [Chelonus insularis]|uniref:inositol-trisphosphate 3-kinase homolog n=1 Tax=Chelonus insularis TaxID=460826 RepID=UPI00158A7E0A|nr:inositol-trisphosphate 3-kinase homolog [Chelonus insularis]